MSHNKQPSPFRLIIAIPLADYVNTLLTWTTYTAVADPITRNVDYLGFRDSLYNAVSNLISVNSDTFVVNIQIQLMDGGSAKNSWYYTALIDRSGCVSDGDSPAILLNNLSHQD